MKEQAATASPVLPSAEFSTLTFDLALRDGIAREDEVVRIVGFGRAMVWKLSKEDPTFPKPRRIKSPRMTVWPRAAVIEWAARKFQQGEAVNGRPPQLERAA